MTKKNDNTLLLVGGGLLAAVAIGALMLGRRPTGDGAGAPGFELPAFLTQSDTFGVHNNLSRYYDFGLLGKYSPGAYLSPENPLAPATFQDRYYPSISDKYQYGATQPPATSSASDIASGYTQAGSTTPSPPPSTDISFGIGGGKYYK